MKPLKEKGDCDTCTVSIDVVLYELHGMKMCEACVTSESDATARAVEASSMIQESRAVDASIEIKVDVFNALTVPAIQLKAAIDNDPNIPSTQKDYVMATESLTRYRHMREAIFAEKAAFAEAMRAKESELRMWQVQVHTFAAKVEGAEKEKFRNFDIQYQPTTPKSIKPAKSSSVKASKFSKSELIAAAKKYNVPMDGIRFIAIQRNLNADGAARILAESLGLTPATK